MACRDDLKIKTRMRKADHLMKALATPLMMTDFVRLGLLRLGEWLWLLWLEVWVWWVLLVVQLLL